MEKVFIKDKESNRVLPKTHVSCVLDDNGTTLETKLQMVKNPVLTLNSAPTSSTLTHTEGGVTYTFKVGDEVRVRDTEKGTAEGNYFVFYILKDKSNNTAYWEESGSGDDTNTTYKININGTETGGGTTSLGTVYAPTTAGTEGQMLIANASGIPAWGSKPTYTLSEVGASMSVEAISANTSSSCSITGAANAGKTQTIVYTNSGSSDLTVTVPTTYSTPDGAAIELTCPDGGYCEVNYINIGGTIYARGL